MGDTTRNDLDTADCCVTIDEARGVIRRLQRELNELSAMRIAADAWSREDLAEMLARALEERDAAQRELARAREQLADARADSERIDRLAHVAIDDDGLTINHDHNGFYLLNPYMVLAEGPTLRAAIDALATDKRKGNE